MTIDVNSMQFSIRTKRHENDWNFLLGFSRTAPREVSWTVKLGICKIESWAHSGRNKKQSGLDEDGMIRPAEKVEDGYCLANKILILVLLRCLITFLFCCEVCAPAVVSFVGWKF